GEVRASAQAGLDLERTSDRRGESAIAVAAELAAAGDRVWLLANDPVRWHGALHALATVDDAIGDRISAVAFGAAAPPAGERPTYAVVAEPPLAPNLLTECADHVTLAWTDAVARIVRDAVATSIVGREHVVASYKALRAETPAAAAGFAARLQA